MSASAAAAVQPLPASTSNPVPSDALDTNAERKISLLKKAVVVLSKQKNELEEKLRQEVEKANSLKGHLAETEEAHSNVVKLNVVLEKQIAELRQQLVGQQQASHGIGSVLSWVPLLDKGKKAAASTQPEGASSNSPQVAGGLNKADTLRLLEENERVHIELFELRQEYERKLDEARKGKEKLQRDFDALQISSSDDRDRLAKEMSALQTHCAALTQDNSRLTSHIASYSHLAAISQRRWSHYDDHENKELSILDVEPAMSESALDLPQHQEFVHAVEHWKGTITALLTACAEVAAKDGAFSELATQLQTLRKIHRSLCSSVCSALTATATAPAGGNWLEPTMLWALRFMDHRKSLLHALLLSCGYAGMDLDFETDRYAEAFLSAFKLVFLALQRMETTPVDAPFRVYRFSLPTLQPMIQLVGELAIKTKDSAILACLRQIEEALHKASQPPPTPPESQEGLRAMDTAVPAAIEVCGMISDTQALRVISKMALQSSLFLRSVNECFCGSSGKTCQVEMLGPAHEEPPQEGVPSPTVVRFGGDDPSNLIALLRAADAKAVEYYEALQRSLVETEEKRKAAEQLCTQLAAAQAKIASQEAERQSICDSYDEQLQLLSVRLADLETKRVE